MTHETQRPEKEPFDNVVFLDEVKRRRWINQLQAARETGEIAVFGTIRTNDELADVIELRPSQNDPETVA